MTAPAPQSPASALFGNELPDPIATSKSILNQISAALLANSAFLTVAYEPVSAPEVGETEVDTLFRWMDVILASIAPVAGSMTLSSSTPVALMKLVGVFGDARDTATTVTVGAGTSSGFKVTIAHTGYTSQVYDNNASIAAAVAAINAAGTPLVKATTLAAGTPVDFAATALSGASGVVWTLPSIPAGNDDNQFVRLAAMCDAVFSAMQVSGYIH